MGHVEAQPFVRLRTGGQPRRKLDVSWAKEGFGFERQTSFEDGLWHAIIWYEGCWEEKAIR